MSWTDEEIDKLFRDKANNQSFDYKAEYWDEVEKDLSSEIPTELVEDAELDQLFVENAENLTFKYKSEYWYEMLALLPRRRRLDFLWFFTAVFFVGLFVSSIFIMDNSFVSLEVQQAKLESDNGDSTSTVQSDREDSQINHNGKDATESNRVNGLQHHSDSSEYSNLIAQKNITDNNDVMIGSDDSVANTVNDGVVRDNANKSSINNNSNNQTAENVVESLPIRPLSALSSNEGMDNQLLALNYDYTLPGFAWFYIEANGGLSQSLITPSERLSYNVGIGLGGQFQKGRLIVSGGVFVNASKHDDLVMSREAKVYGFGSDLYRYEISYDELYKIEASISIGYKLGRHQFNVGVRPSYLFNTKVGFVIENGLGESNERKAYYGYMDGLSSWGLKPMIGYSYDISSKWTIGLNAGMQLMPAVNEDFINGVNNKLPIDGQLYLRRYLRFKR